MPDEMLQQINQKIDMLVRDKIDVQYYRDRHEDLEKRVEKIEERLEATDEKINGLHNDSMKFVNEAFTAMERRILDKIEANAKFSLSNWVLIGIAAIGWVIGIGAIAVAILR